VGDLPPEAHALISQREEVLRLQIGRLLKVGQAVTVALIELGSQNLLLVDRFLRLREKPVDTLSAQRGRSSQFRS
jgi:hypothetical protein